MQLIRLQQTRGKIAAAIAFSFIFALAPGLLAQRNPVPALDETGFKSIFDGQSLKDWDSDPDFWRAENGVMIGETRADHQPKHNIFCIWKGGSPGDFELKLQYRLTGETGNSGIQYRSVELPDVGKWVLKGYQADIDGKQMYTGQLYEERGRGFLALRGQISYVPNGNKVGYIGSTGGDDLKALIRDNDWNDMHIIARGNTLIHLINGRVMSVVVDDDTANRKMDGKIGIQLHVTTAAMKMEVRNIRLKTF
jgi:3-keto-disaccharide hydrolase